MNEAMMLLQEIMDHVASVASFPDWLRFQLSDLQALVEDAAFASKLDAEILYELHLRDQIAMQALQGMIEDVHVDELIEAGIWAPEDIPENASAMTVWAYFFADRMLETRLIGQ